MGKRLRMIRIILCVIYNDRFCWSFIKSYAFFFVAMRLAKSFRGFELMPASVTAI
ncbi:uncharacterized protein LOC115627706 [Scaptodrosophila lebanonensis]|uniref:Uncharacterized protein LOC115627706 n=1 Tax=Drosophila lebanonensis TaxID=7225 RepID=A0A6J2TTB4_DROLE|nr:uncharacterized protein LOC115627706 [Scaptodrosophila lebanonensis]